MLKLGASSCILIKSHINGQLKASLKLNESWTLVWLVIDSVFLPCVCFCRVSVSAVCLKIEEHHQQDSEDTGNGKYMLMIDFTILIYIIKYIRLAVLNSYNLGMLLCPGLVGCLNVRLKTSSNTF